MANAVSDAHTARVVWRAPLGFALASLVVGAVLRIVGLSHVTVDATLYLLPWYKFVLAHGRDALGSVFTNYTPVYSYLLLGASRLDGVAAPLTLIKSISVLFDLGCATAAAELVLALTGRPWRGAFAFAAVWLAPTVVWNSAFWGQTDAIWAFFALVSISVFVRRGNGMVPYAVAFAIKAQAIFLGPFVLGVVLKRRLSLAWFLAIPAVYLGLALPVLLAGRSLSSVLGIYLDQADTYHELALNAASLWALPLGVSYESGMRLGLAATLVAGLALAWRIRRHRADDPTFLLLSACTSLLLMPYLLPKMHDRYFYAFEVASIALACVERRYWPIAVIAQIDALFAYLAYDPGIGAGPIPAAVGNAAIAFLLVRDMVRAGPGSSSAAAPLAPSPLPM